MNTLQTQLYRIAVNIVIVNEANTFLYLFSLIFLWSQLIISHIEVFTQLVISTWFTLERQLQSSPVHKVSSGPPPMRHESSCCCKCLCGANRFLFPYSFVISSDDLLFAVVAPRLVCKYKTLREECIYSSSLFKY